MAIKKYTCPKCGHEISIDVQALTAMGNSIVCPECQSVLKADGDFLYIPTENQTFEPVEPAAEGETPPPFSKENIIGEDSASATLYDKAVEYISTCNAISIPMLMRYFSIEEKEATELMRELEQRGVVGPFTGGPREILIPHNTGLPSGVKRTFETDQLLKKQLERLRQAQQNGDMPKMRSCTCSLPSFLLLVLLAWLIYSMLH